MPRRKESLIDYKHHLNTPELGESTGKFGARIGYCTSLSRNLREEGDLMAFYTHSLPSSEQAEITAKLIVQKHLDQHRLYGTDPCVPTIEFFELYTNLTANSARESVIWVPI